MRLLVVEDDRNLREQLVAALNDAGYTVDIADNGEDGQFLGETEPYDLAILDIMGVDGMALLTQTANQRIPTVMLTAHAMNPQTLKASILNGALSYLPKEELANLAEHIDDVLDAVEKGQPTWKRLFTKLGKFFEKSFGPAWTSDDPDFWKYYYGSML